MGEDPGPGLIADMALACAFAFVYGGEAYFKAMHLQNSIQDMRKVL